MHERERNLTGAEVYQRAGVDIDAGDLAKARIAQRIAETHGPDVLGRPGHFGAFYRAPGRDNPYVLVSSADSVGTKVLIAALAGRHRGIGIDLVNHCVNDILACGARPLYVLDYFAGPSLDQQVLADIIDGLSEACRAAGCALIGGETAQLPGIYRQGAYDLAGFIVGSVHQDRVVDGSSVMEDDILIGLAANGVHTNGYSLVRAALGLDADPAEARRALAQRPLGDDATWADLLLEPHPSYLAQVEPLLDSGWIAGMAHITGGGLVGNVSRVIPDGLEAVIDARSWRPLPLFAAIQTAGDVATGEMYRVFNMGIGFVLIVRPERAPAVLAAVGGASVIGQVRRASTAARARLIGLDGADDR